MVEWAARRKEEKEREDPRKKGVKKASMRRHPKTPTPIDVNTQEIQKRRSKSRDRIEDLEQK